MKYANFKIHILAFLLDYLIISAYIIFLITVSVILASGPLKEPFKIMFSNPNYSEISAFILLVFPVILYFTLLESSSLQATFGKKKMKLIVTDSHGAKLTFMRSLIRSSFKFLPWELTHACIWRIPNWPFSPSSPSLIISIGLLLV